MESSNFFRKVAELDLTGNLQLTIAKGAENRYVVSVLLHNEACGDNAKKRIIPYNLRGTAEELDTLFFERVTKPMQTASGLMDNMETFLKQTEEAKKQSAMEKQKTDREKKEKDTKTSKYDTAMAKVNELDKAGKPREAWMKLPDPADFPEHTDDIRKRRSELSAQFAPDLFADPQPEPAQPTSTVENAETDEPADDETMNGEMVFEENEY